MEDIIEYEEVEVMNLKIFIFAIFLTFFIFLLIANTITYQKYYYNKAIIYRDNNDFYLKMYVDIDDIEDIIKNDTIKIDEEEYKYHVFYIQKDLYVNESYNNYQEIMLKTTIKYPVENRVVNVSIKTKQEKIIEFLLEIIKGGNLKNGT